MTLYYLSTGDGFSTIALLFMLGASTVRSIIFETCSAIWDEMKGQNLKASDTACNGLLSFSLEGYKQMMKILGFAVTFGIHNNNTSTYTFAGDLRYGANPAL